ncbi:hypothetical protein [Chryseobacterium sp. c4a]|uniref:hypothetical protein n=1 Tax=Chryseobacterium sp. c4a TaxID=1573582 RepID=UPI001358E476|nr:hypothetical protein [Chryseobacterium sp. c4a]
MNFKSLSLLLLVVLTLYSCRTDDDDPLHEKTESVSYKKIDDQKLPLVFYKSYKVHPVQNNENFNPNGKIDFRFSTQVFNFIDGRRGILFPLVKEKKVNGLVLAALSKDEKTVYLSDLSNIEDQMMKSILLQVSLEYNKKFNNPNARWIDCFNEPHNPNCTDEPPINEIPGVIITVPGPGLPWPIDPGIGLPTFPDFPDLPIGGDIVAMTMAPPPDVAINDIKKFLSCLNISQSAKLSVYAEKMGSGHGVGHAFISITQGNNTMTYGFYPKTGLTGVITGPGIFGDDGGHIYTHSWNVGNITPTQLQNIIAASISYSGGTYDLGLNNCADFTLTILNYAGVATNTSGIDHPNTVANLIENNNGNTTQGNAPQSKGCQ